MVTPLPHYYRRLGSPDADDRLPSAGSDVASPSLFGKAGAGFPRGSSEGWNSGGREHSPSLRGVARSMGLMKGDGAGNAAGHRQARGVSALQVPLALGRASSADNHTESETMLEPGQLPPGRAFRAGDRGSDRGWNAAARLARPPRPPGADKKDAWGGSPQCTERTAWRNAVGSQSQGRSASQPSLRLTVSPAPPTAAQGGPPSRYIDACNERGILPKFARPVQASRVGVDIDLNGLGLGDTQLTCLLCDPDLMPMEELSRLRLRDNRLTDIGLKALAAKLSGDVELLDIARNEVSGSAFEFFARRIQQDLLPQLRCLDLSSNGLRSATAAELARALIHCPELVRLELNNNMIQDGSALGKMVADHKYLMRLSVHCNVLAGLGVAAVFQGVLRNSRNGGRLADLDVAWNGAGEGASAKAAAEAISEALKESVTLYHLDLSYNSLDAACAALIGVGLKDNHHLYGLHMVGNSGMVDADGFLSPLNSNSSVSSLSPAQSEPIASSPLPPKLNVSRGWNTGTPTSRDRDPMLAARLHWSDDDMLRERDVLEHRSTCWACEGWERVELTWPVKSGEPSPTAVWAFTSLDGFRAGVRLQRSADGSKFFSARMVPAGAQILAIFQVDSALRIPVELDSQTLPQPAEIPLRVCPELPELQPPADQDVATHRVETSKAGVEVHEIVLRLKQAAILPRAERARPKVADSQAGCRVVLLDGPKGVGAVQMPRVTETEYRMTTKVARGKPFFSAFKKETESVLKECFQLDWGRVKSGRLVKESEILEVQALIQKHYRKVLAIYRQLSSAGVAGEGGFGVNQIALSDAMVGAGLVDGDGTKLSDIDRLFIAAKVTPIDLKKGLAVRQDKALTRYQFVELILRVADQRFIQPGLCKSMPEGVTKVLDAFSTTGDGLVASLDSFLSAFHTEAVDDVCKKYHDTLHLIYQRYSGKLTPPGQAKYMSLGEFQTLLEHMNAYDEDFIIRKSAIAFRMGMMTQPEESYNSRFQEMSFLEFLHGLGAVVYMRSNYTAARMAALLEEILNNKMFPAVLSKREGGGTAAPSQPEGSPVVRPSAARPKSSSRRSGSKNAG